jgi:hypothetical protein
MCRGEKIGLSVTVLPQDVTYEPELLGTDCVLHFHFLSAFGYLFNQLIYCDFNDF